MDLVRSDPPSDEMAETRDRHFFSSIDIVWSRGHLTKIMRCSLVRLPPTEVQHSIGHNGTGFHPQRCSIHFDTMELASTHRGAASHLTRWRGTALHSTQWNWLLPLTHWNLNVHAANPAKRKPHIVFDTLPCMSVFCYRSMAGEQMLMVVLSCDLRKNTPFSYKPGLWKPPVVEEW